MLLGTYCLLPNQKNYVELSTKSAKGIVVADAVLFVLEEQPDKQGHRTEK